MTNTHGDSTETTASSPSQGPLFETPRAHLRAEFLRVQHWLRRYQARHASRYKPSEQGYLHAFVTVDEMAGILQNSAPAALPHDDNLDLLTTQVCARAQASLEAGRSLPLETLRTSLRLDQAGYDLMVALLAPEVSVNLQRAFRHAYADFTQQHGSWPFFVELLAEAGHSAAAVERWLRPSSGLAELGLAICEATDGDIEDAPPTRIRILASPFLVLWAAHGAQVPAATSPALERRHFVEQESPRLVLPQGVMADAARALSWVRAAKKRRLLLVGPHGSGRRALINELEGRLVALDLSRLPANAAERARLVRVARLEARIGRTPLYVHGLEALSFDDRDAGQRGANAVLERLLQCDDAMILGVERSVTALRTHLGEQALVELRVPMPTGQEQREIWQHIAPETLEPEVDFGRLVSHYSLTGGAMQLAVASASARLSGTAADHISAEMMTQALRQQLGHALGDLATRVHTQFKRDDLVVKPEITKQLTEITALFRDRETLLTRWGFDRKMPYGRGLTVLFGGPPGTGKTMAAGVMAAELGLELFKVNLAQVTDKYIGETEKKLERVFDEAGRGQAILLFDEADSLFARRTEVASSTDRYANAGVNYLLQRMEAYEGITVLTTNLEANLDPAFKRRIRFKLAFEAPDTDQRYDLWKTMLPPAERLSDDIDLDELAEDYELVGADILGILYKAAARAIQLDRRLDHELILGAVEDLHRERGFVVRRRRSIFDD